MKKNHAFTLIELLVVIAIIALLAATILVSMNKVREKARDKERKADLSMIKNALEMYYSQNHTFPGTGSNTCYNSGDAANWNDSADLNPTSVPVSQKLSTYISLPDDPVNTDLNIYVYKRINNSSYVLYANLENASDSDCVDGNCSVGIDPGCGGDPVSVNYEVKG